MTLPGPVLEYQQEKQIFNHFTSNIYPGGDDDLYSYRRGDIPIFNFDEADRVLVSDHDDLFPRFR